MNFRPLLLGLLAPLMAVAAHAQETDSESLHVIRPLVQSAQEEAELCLEFDHTLDATATVGRVAPVLHLERDGKAVTLSPKNISVGGNQLCISGLQHRADYRFSLGALRDAKGDKVSRPYSLSFTVPPRHPALAFVKKAERDGLSLWRDNPILHSVNAARITVELYRISDPLPMAEAWNQRLQTTLAPSESLYFARTNGTLIWKGELTPDEARDKTVESVLDFAGAGSGAFAPGLYLIAATDADPLPAQDSDDQTSAKDDSDSKNNALPPTAATWLLRSELSLHALRDDRSMVALVDQPATATVTPAVRVIAIDRTPKIIAEAQSDATGQALFTTSPDINNDAQILMALGGKGDVAFADLARTGAATLLAPPMAATVTVDQSIYAPMDIVMVNLSARDLHHRHVTLSGSTLQLLRADHSLYDTFPVALDPGGAARLSLTAPVGSGLWHLVWKQNDGAVLAENTFRISDNPAAPVITMQADHTTLASDSAINLTLHSVTANQKPAPYISGHIDLIPTKSDHPFAAWKDYSFDDGRVADGKTRHLGSFLTNANGVAHLNLTLPANDQASGLRQADLRLVSEASFGALDPPPLLLTVKPADFVVGIKPLAAKGHFPENSLARFDVLALGSDNQPRGIDDLTYQIYEEGRSFEWQQSDGHWDYKPQPQSRRIGGGVINFGGNGHGAIEWPLTSGAYRLDIARDDGTLMARAMFNAGWGVADKQRDDVAVLDMKAVPTILQKDREEEITFTLPHPALVTATVADDHIRKIIHAAYPAGVGSLSFMLTADWGDRVAVQVKVHYTGMDGAGAHSAGKMMVAQAAENLLPHNNPKLATPAAALLLPHAPLNLHQGNEQRLPPQQSWTPAAAHTAASLVFIATDSLFNLPRILSTALQQHPLTTADLAQHMQMLRQWHDAIVTAGLLNEADYKMTQNDARLRLLARQQSDGGFAALPAATGSDVGSTAAALEALLPLADAGNRSVIDLAGGWLRHRLENTWFDEEDRPQRAAAYAALATAGKLDLASLHYFSDTSADKTLPALAEAQIAYAFAAINDRPASQFWLDKVKGNATPETLPALLGNAYYNPADAREILATASQQSLAKPEDIQLTGTFLNALWRYYDRSGAWRVTVGKEEKNLRGILVVPAALLRNPATDHALTLLPVVPERSNALPNAIERHIYSLDGNEQKGTLKRGAVYLVMIEGSWPVDASPLQHLHENPLPDLLPVGCTIEAPSADSFLGWLSYKTLSTPQACEKSATGLDIMLKHEGKEWRVAYLAKALTHDKPHAMPPVLRTLAVPNPDDKDAPH